MVSNFIPNIQSNLDNITIAEAVFVETSDCLSKVYDASNSLKIISHNIRSIYRNLDHFLVFLSQLGTDCDILIFTEC